VNPGSLIPVRRPSAGPLCGGDYPDQPVKQWTLRHFAACGLGGGLGVPKFFGGEARPPPNLPRKGGGVGPVGLARWCQGCDAAHSLCREDWWVSDAANLHERLRGTESAPLPQLRMVVWGAAPGPTPTHLAARKYLRMVSGLRRNDIEFMAALVSARRQQDPLPTSPQGGRCRAGGLAGSCHRRDAAPSPLRGGEASAVHRINPHPRSLPTRGREAQDPACRAQTGGAHDLPSPFVGEGGA